MYHYLFSFSGTLYRCKWGCSNELNALFILLPPGELQISLRRMQSTSGNCLLPWRRCVIYCCLRQVSRYSFRLTYGDCLCVVVMHKELPYRLNNACDCAIVKYHSIDIFS